jgi:NDP-sugar pyrophosphorylase family protein
MGESLAGVVLAAGRGTRLRPLTRERPKALCPVGDTTLVDQALALLAPIGLAGAAAVAVNTHHLAPALHDHLEGRVHLSHEVELLGTGGALGRLRPWIGDRPLVLVNADAMHDVSLARLLEDWGGETIRFLVASRDEAPAPSSARLDASTRLCATLMPALALHGLSAEPSSVYDQVWRPWEAAGRTEVIPVATPFFDCGTPSSYLEANLWRSGGDSVVAAGAVVRGVLERSVVWPGAVVHAGEVLCDSIRTTHGITVAVRRL